MKMIILFFIFSNLYSADIKVKELDDKVKILTDALKDISLKIDQFKNQISTSIFPLTKTEESLPNKDIHELNISIKKIFADLSETNKKIDDFSKDFDEIAQRLNILEEDLSNVKKRLTILESTTNKTIKEEEKKSTFKKISVFFIPAAILIAILL